MLWNNILEILVHKNNTKFTFSEKKKTITKYQDFAPQQAKNS